MLQLITGKRYMNVMYEIQAIEFKKINVTQLQSLQRKYANNDMYRMVLDYVHNMLFQQTPIRTNQFKIAVAVLYIQIQL